MLTEAAHCLNVEIIFLDAETARAKQIDARPDHINGSFTEPGAARHLAKECDLLLVEIEDVDTNVLEDVSVGAKTKSDWRLVPSTKVEVQPSWQTIRVIWNKNHQKEHLIKHRVPTALSIPIENNRTVYPRRCWKGACLSC